MTFSHHIIMANMRAWLDNLQHRISNEFVMHRLENKKIKTSSLTIVAHNCVAVHSRRLHQSCFAFDLFSRFHVRVSLLCKRRIHTLQRIAPHIYGNNSNCFMATFYYYNISKIHASFTHPVSMLICFATTSSVCVCVWIVEFYFGLLCYLSESSHFTSNSLACLRWCSFSVDFQPLNN